MDIPVIGRPGGFCCWLAGGAEEVGNGGTDLKESLRACRLKITQRFLKLLNINAKRDKFPTSQTEYLNYPNTICPSTKEMVHQNYAKFE
jgi:hypothetical protein